MIKILTLLPVVLAACLPSGVIAQETESAPLVQPRNPQVRQFIVSDNGKAVRATVRTPAEGKAQAMRFSRAMNAAGLAGSVTFAGQVYDGSLIFSLQNPLSFEEARTAAKKITSLLGGGQSVEPSYPTFPHLTPSDPNLSNSWPLNTTNGGRINAQTANGWAASTGLGSIIAVLDTGYLKHPDLWKQLPWPPNGRLANSSGGTSLPAGAVATNLITLNGSVFGYDFKDGDSDPVDPGDWVLANQCPFGNSARDSSWHGTHVSGIIGAVGNNGEGSVGVAYNARLLEARVLGTCGGTDHMVANAITWASGGRSLGKPKNNTPADVINASLGWLLSVSPQPIIPCPLVVQNAVTAAIARGTTIVVSTGNEGQYGAGLADRSYPANCIGVIAVTSHNSNGAHSNFGNTGTVVDVSGPGGSIYSTYNSGLTTASAYSYKNLSGTSMAAPHVASVAAMINAIRPDLTPADIESIIKNSNSAFPAPCTGCGTGLLNLDAALLAASTAPSPLATVSESEPNDAPGTAQLIANPIFISGTMGGAGSNPNDYYQVTVPANSVLRVWLSQTGTVGAKLSIVNAANAFVGIGRSAENGGLRASYVNDTLAPITLKVRIVQKATAPLQTYKLMVKW
jgi:serine protease